MARNAAAMPAALWKKRRRLTPRRLAICAPSVLTRASNARCFCVCGPGMNSSLETDCTGIGDGNRDSADASLDSSSGESMLIDSSFVATRVDARGAADDGPTRCRPADPDRYVR